MRLIFVNLSFIYLFFSLCINRRTNNIKHVIMVVICYWRIFNVLNMVTVKKISEFQMIKGNSLKPTLLIKRVLTGDKISDSFVSKKRVYIVDFDLLINLFIMSSYNHVHIFFFYLIKRKIITDLKKHHIYLRFQEYSS